jgi:hypothetical protein
MPAKKGFSKAPKGRRFQGRPSDELVQSKNTTSFYDEWVNRDRDRIFQERRELLKDRFKLKETAADNHALQIWRGRIDKLIVADVLDPDIFRYEESLLNIPSEMEMEQDTILDDASEDFRDHLDEEHCGYTCNCKDGEVCIKCCTKLDLEALPKLPNLRTANHRFDSWGEVFDIFLPEGVAEDLGIVAKAA